MKIELQSYSTYNKMWKYPFFYAHIDSLVYKKFNYTEKDITEFTIGQIIFEDPLNANTTFSRFLVPNCN